MPAKSRSLQCSQPSALLQKKLYQNLIIMCPCACGIVSKALRFSHMLLSCGVSAITFILWFSSTKFRTEALHVFLVRQRNENKEQIHGRYVLELACSAFIFPLQSTKQPRLRCTHVRAKSPSPRSKRIKRLLDAIKSTLLSCYPPETSSSPQILKQ